MKHFYVIVERSNWSNFKLGFADNVGLRLSYLQTGNASELSVCDCGLIKNYKQFEKFVHRAFKDKKIRGEWYQLTPEDLHLLYDILEDSRDKCDCRACLGYYSASSGWRKTSDWQLRKGVYALA